ncbi:MAG TPA: hypothetical protein VGF28_26235 [Thermoanaerobaculia bacterium]|jgi:hypothetical protein
MRSSSVKSLVVAVSFVVISATAVTAEARPSRPSAGTAVTRAAQTLKELQKRFVGVISHYLVGPPLPAPTASTNDTFDRTAKSKY